MLTALKNFKNYIMAGLTALLILAGAVFWRNRNTQKPTAVQSVLEEKSKELAEQATIIESTNSSITEKQESAVEFAKPVKPVKSRTLEDALKEWNKP